ncbi:MAG: T9SS type B sorting domain-containing protein [Flavobacterium stagni]
MRQMKNGYAWDGTYNGALCPSDDYWFVVKRADGIIHKGHFTLKR